jgi:hypothetical protein
MENLHRSEFFSYCGQTLFNRLFNPKTKQVVRNADFFFETGDYSSKRGLEKGSLRKIVVGRSSYVVRQIKPNAP